MPIPSTVPHRIDISAVLLQSYVVECLNFTR